MRFALLSVMFVISWETLGLIQRVQKASFLSCDRKTLIRVYVCYFFVVCLLFLVCCVVFSLLISLVGFFFFSISTFRLLARLKLI